MLSRLILAAVLCAPGCKDAESDKSPPAGAQRPTARSVSARCLRGERIPAELRTELEANARRVFALVATGDLESVWGTLHPQARRDDRKEAFVEALGGPSQRLAGASEPPTIEFLTLVDFSGGASDVAEVQCGELGSPDSVTLVANVGDEDVAFVALISPGPVFSQAATIQLRRRGQHWRLVGLQVNPSHYRGRSALELEADADRHRAAQKAVPAYLALAAAQTLASRGHAVTTAAKGRIDAKLEALSKDQLFTAHVGTWQIGNSRLLIHGFSLAATQSDLSAVVKYVAPGGLDAAQQEAEADGLVAYVKAQYPDLAQMFDAVVFEAYAERPIEPRRSYEAYRVVRPL